MNRLHKLLPEMREKYPLLDLRDTWLDQGIVVIKPGNESPEGPLMSERGASAQCSYIADNIYRLASDLGVKTAIWDTLTADASRCLRELATARYSDHKTDAVRMSVPAGGGTMRRMAQPTLPQIGMVQNWIRDKVRAPLLEDPTCHLFLSMHHTTAMKSAGKDKDGNRIEFPVFHGPDAGGRSSCEHWGKDFSSLHKIYLDGDKRMILLNNETDAQKIPQAARTGMGDGSDVKKAVIPRGLKGCVDLHRKIFEWQGFVPGQEDKYGFMSNTTYGVQSCGKTWWLMCLLAIREMLPAILIASDGNSEFLRVCPNEIRTNVWKES